MTKEYLLSKTLYGTDIICHLIRKEYPDFIMKVKGDDCGECPDPVWADGRLIRITIDRSYKDDQRLPERKARYRYEDESLPNGDAIALATAYWHERGENLSHQEIIDRLASELAIREPEDNPYCPLQSKNEEPHDTDKTEKGTIPPAPKFSFFRRPIRNTRPCREASPEDIYRYLVSDYAALHTETLRAIADSRERSRYKAEHLDYVTPGGIFRSRRESDLVKASGYMVIDFDHIPGADGLIKKLATDEHFETVLAFRSPSGDGVKWIVALPNITRPDGTPFTHGEFFTMLSNYSRKAYGIEADPSGKDICRACFLPHDPDAFLNPLYIETDIQYDIDRFLH